MKKPQIRLIKADPNTTKGIVFRNVFTYFNMIFLVLAVLLIAAGSFKSLTFLPVVVGNTVLGIIQQLRAKKVLDRLTILSESKYTVLRGGQMLEAGSSELMKDDIVLLSGGRQIPADAEVTEGSLAVNEALLTGESDEIEKRPGDALMSGSFIVSGDCKAKLTAVGEDSYISRLTKKAKEVREKQSEMIHDIELIIKIAGAAIIPIGVALFCQAVFVNGADFSSAVVSMVGAVIGMIPEGLYLLTTVALALSAMRLAGNQVLLHDMKSTETLARVDVLCVDKTGTITSGEMKLTEAVAPDGKPVDGADDRVRLLLSFLAALDDGSATAEAVKAAFPDVSPVKLDVTETVRFTSRLKYSQVVCYDHERNTQTLRFGAPEFILGDTGGKYSALVADRAKKGSRVLTFARLSPCGGFEPVLFVSVANSIRPGAADTFKYFAEQDVRVVVISGDNPLTVSNIASAVGIPGAESCVDASTLTSPEDISAAVGEYTVFGRVRPEQKKDLVAALRAKGNKVAMTGDGVNDILAMKEADCSIAMGEGSDAARRAAQVVLLDSDFSHMKQIITEGRKDINNIMRSSTLFLYKNIFSMLLAAFSIIGAMTYPLHPSQVSLVSAFNIGLPAFLLALELNTAKQKGRFIKNALLKAFPASLTSFAAIAAMMVFGRTFGIDAQSVGTASTYLLSFAGFMLLLRLCRPFRKFRAAVFAFCVAGFIVCSLFFADLFSITAPSAQCVMLAAVFAVAEESVMRWLSLLFERLGKREKKNKKNLLSKVVEDLKEMS